MSQQASGHSQDIAAGGWIRRCVAVLSDRLTLMTIAWAVLALWLRPLFLDAHHGDIAKASSDIRASFGAEGVARMAASMQWASFAGAILLAVMAHMRLAAGGTIPGRLTRLIVFGYAALITAAYVVFLWGPESVFTLITHDSLIFVDSSYRILNGERPSVDFPTAIGAAALYLPALGAKLAGGYAGSVELASALLALGLGAAVAQAAAARYPTAVSIALVGLVFLIAVPASLLEHWGGETITIVDGRAEILADDLTWAMFYNRWGWAAMVPVFAFLAPRRDGAAPSWADLSVFAALLTFLFWLKLSYFVVGLGAAGAYALMNVKPWRTLAIGGGLTAAGVLGVGLATGILFSYLADIALAGQVSGGRAYFLLPILRKNLQDILLAAAPLAILFAVGRATWRDALAGAVIILGSLFIINQNGQLTNMVTLALFGAYGVARVWSDADAGRMAKVASMGAFILLSAGTFLDRGMMLIDQAYAARREENRPPAEWSAYPALKGLYVPERESIFARVGKAETLEQRLEQVSIAGQLGSRQELRQGDYMATLMDGAADLRRVLQPGESVSTLDMTNPFPAMLGARSPKGSWLTIHKDRTISTEHHPAPEVFFADADHVMIAKASMVQPTADLMLEIYGPWLDAHYETRAQTDHWHRWSRRKAD